MVEVQPGIQFAGVAGDDGIGATLVSGTVEASPTTVSFFFLQAYRRVS